jgi:superfamily II DNA or RNA helicase
MSIALRNYQADICCEIDRLDHPLVPLPTGAGKTVIAAAIIRDAVRPHDLASPDAVLHHVDAVARQRLNDTGDLATGETRVEAEGHTLGVNRGNTR